MHRGTKVLLLLAQPPPVHRAVPHGHRLLPPPGRSPAEAPHGHEELQLTNVSRIVCLPCREETIRGYSNVSLLVIDEAARVPDDLYRAVRPMLAVSDGRLICLSTPYGKRGFFYDAWANGGDDWHAHRGPRRHASAHRAGVPGRGAPRAWASPGSARNTAVPSRPWRAWSTPTSPAAWSAGPAPAGGRQVGGIDFGFRNPFAAVWGILDRDGVLWLTGEHYARQKPLSYHAQHLPRDVTWYADPSGRQRADRAALCRLHGAAGRQRPASRASPR